MKRFYLMPEDFSSGKPKHIMPPHVPLDTEREIDLQALVMNTIQQADGLVIDMISKDEGMLQAFIGYGDFRDNLVDTAYARTALNYFCVWKEVEKFIPRIMSDVAQSYAERGFVVAQAVKKRGKSGGIWIRPEGSLEIE